MTVRSIKIDAVWKRGALFVAGAACAIGAWQSAGWGLANSAAYRAADAEVAQYLAEMAPSDPQTHYAAAVMLEKSFDPADIDRALRHLELAVALSPNNYLLWLDLGRARERSGDAEGAERALRRSLELAPNYSRVQWALGNALLRQGRTEEAFAEIRKSVIGDGSYAAPAASSAWQFFDGDVRAIRAAMKDSVRFDAALAELLVREKRFDEALQIWNDIPLAARQGELRDTANTIANKLFEAKIFRDSLRVRSDIGADGNAPRLAAVTNGGFESAVKTEGAGLFDWKIAAGLQPQIAISGGQKHGGNNSLLLVFDSRDGKDFRTVSQTVAVEPGVEFDFEFYYRSDLKTSARIRWEVSDASDGKQIAVSDPIQPRADWSPLRVRFRTPQTSDGIVIRMILEPCGQICPISGSLWFDDISIRQVGQ